MPQVEVCDQENILRVHQFRVLVLETGMVTVLHESFLPPRCTVAVIPVHPSFFNKIIFGKD